MNKSPKNKTGRPKKITTASIVKKFRVTPAEDEQIRRLAQQHNMTMTAYIKTFAVSGKLEVKHKQVNQEIIAMIALIKNIGQNVNSMAHRNNRGDFLTAVDKENLRQWLNTLMGKVKKMEDYFYDS